MVQAFQKGTDKENATNVAESDDTIKGDAPDIHIGKVILQGGQVDFTDRSLPYPFNADMRELGGLIEGLSSASDSRATVDLRGSLRNQSPLTISGMVNPLAEQLFLDLELNFRDIEMSPFSPYSSNFVGYLIEKGKLNLTLNYSIDNNQLKASNKIFLDQFSFGAAVESEEAISLPVKLAVALLKDRKGEIHLDIPVYGSLDDPQFSVAGVIWTVIKNLLVKAATSPFALIGAMLGGVDEDFSNVSFELGSARLSPPEKNKLLRMAQALVDRPNLEVEVSGFIDPDNDAEGYRREQLSMQIKRLKYLELLKELPEGTDEEDVTVTAEEYPDFLWQVYSKADFPKPRNFIGMTKKLPEAEMEKLLYANTLVTQDHLSALAQTRALTVQNFLIEEGQLARERIFLKKPDITAAPKQETTDRARVELNATVR
jgi:outer membrane protein OmpA-like peptidoglycan-associated protein